MVVSHDRATAARTGVGQLDAVGALRTDAEEIALAANDVYRHLCHGNLVPGSW
jgi:hypothetical protein